MPQHQNDRDRSSSSALDDALREFGEPSARFTADMLQIYMGMAFGVLFVAAAIGFVPMVFVKGWNPFWCLLAPLGAAIGAWLFRIMKAMRGQVVYVCKEGLIVWHGEDNVDACRWGDIQQVEERIITDNMPLKGLAGHIPIGSSTSLGITWGDDRTFNFGGENLKGARRLANLIREEAKKRDIPWETVEI